MLTAAILGLQTHPYLRISISVLDQHLSADQAAVQAKGCVSPAGESAQTASQAQYLQTSRDQNHHHQGGCCQAQNDQKPVEEERRNRGQEYTCAATSREKERQDNSFSTTIRSGSTSYGMSNVALPGVGLM